MSNIIQCDNYQIKSHRITDEGYLNFIAPIAKVGTMKYYYRTSNNDVAELEQVVTDRVLIKSADSFKMKPLTSPHPEIRAIDANTSKPYVIGSTGHSYLFDGSYLWFSGVSFDGNVNKQILDGTRKGLSPGYAVKLKKLTDYKYEQIDRKGNHLSVVKLGRGGKDIKFITDNDDAETIDDLIFYYSQLDEELVDLDTPKDIISQFWVNDERTIVDLKPEPKHKRNKFMTQILIGSKIFNVDGDDSVALRDEVAKLIDLKNQLELSQNDSKQIESKSIELGKQLAEAESKLSVLQGQLDAKVEEIEQLKSTQLDAETIGRKVKESLETWGKVLPYLKQQDDSFEPDFSASPEQIRAIALAVKYPNLKDKIAGLDLNTDSAKGYLEGLYESTDFTVSGGKNYLDGILDTINKAELSNVVNDSVDSAEQRSAYIKALVSKRN